MSQPLHDVVRFLDACLRVSEIPDDTNAVNGLQLEASSTVSRVACAVDAGEASIEAACSAGADLLVVHHGLLWGGNRPLVGAHARKLRRCFGAGLSIYSAHLPLDIHPQHGNNALIVRALGLAPAEQSFAPYRGVDVGLVAGCDLSLGDLLARVRGAIGDCRVVGRGPERVRRIGILSGGGGSYVAEAAKAGVDALVTGEGPHHAAVLAEEVGVAVVLAGHYRTETFGVKALGGLLAQEFGLKHSFLEHDTGL